MAVDIDKMTNVLVVYNNRRRRGSGSASSYGKNCLRTKEDGSGNMGILLAMNNFGEEIYVNPEEETAARAVIEDWRREKKEEREKAATVPQSEAAEKGNKMLLPRVIAGIALVIIVALYISHLR